METFVVFHSKVITGNGYQYTTMSLKVHHIDVGSSLTVSARELMAAQNVISATTNSGSDLMFGPWLDLEFLQPSRLRARSVILGLEAYGCTKSDRHGCTKRDLYSKSRL